MVHGAQRMGLAALWGDADVACIGRAAEAWVGYSMGCTHLSLRTHLTKWPPAGAASPNPSPTPSQCGCVQAWMWATALVYLVWRWRWRREQRLKAEQWQRDEDAEEQLRQEWDHFAQGYGLPASRERGAAAVEAAPAVAGAAGAAAGSRVNR